MIISSATAGVFPILGIGRNLEDALTIKYIDGGAATAAEWKGGFPEYLK